MNDAFYPAYALFWALDGLWNIVMANWLLTLCITLLFVEFGVRVIKKTYKKEDE